MRNSTRRGGQNHYRKKAMSNLRLKPNTFYRRVARWEESHGQYDPKLDRYYKEDEIEYKIKNLSFKKTRLICLLI